MADIIFIYMNNEYLMKNVDNNKYIIDILQRYSKIINFNINELNFFYRGKLLKNIMNKMIHNLNAKTINIFVTKIKNSKQNKKKDNNILCNICHSPAILNLEEEEKISLYNCIKKHKASGLTIKEFIENQKIGEKINCDICGISKIHYNKDFNINSEDKIICPMCSYSRSKEFMLEYTSSIFNNCKRHFNEYISYCDTCKKNLCERCEEEHSKHKILLFKKIFPENKINSIKHEIEKNKKNINLYQHELRKIKTLFSEAIKNEMNYSDNYIQLYETISKNLHNSKNYETLNNILNFKFKNLNKDISNFLKDNLNDKIKYILKKFNESKEGIVTYEIKDNNSRIKIFGKDFVQNNKENCFIFKNNTIFDIDEYYSINKEKKNFQIKLITSENMKSLKNMFFDCVSLLSFPSMSEWNTTNITDMSGIFNNCTQLQSLPDISKWNTENVSDMSYMFNNCSSLRFLPDISKWNTKNVDNMSYMFNNCSSLQFLPDISKWNTKNVFYLNSIFENCKALKKLPDINKWDTINTISINNIFNNCISLIDLPDISKWKTSRLTDINSIFCNCRNLKYIPDISKWDTQNIKYLNNVFENCESLTELPDISDWNISNAISLNKLFSNCKSLMTLPDISKWDMSKVKDMSYLFYNCQNLSCLPDISKWNINTDIKMEKIFCGCTSLKNIIPDISIWKLTDEQYKKMYDENSVFSRIIKDIYYKFLINFKNALKIPKKDDDNKKFHLEILTSRDYLNGLGFEIFNLNESRYLELFDSSLNIQGDFLLSLSLNSYEKETKKNQEILKKFFSDFLPNIIQTKFEKKYKNKNDLIICEFFAKEYKKNELNFDFELINYFKYFRLNCIFKSLLKFEDCLSCLEEEKKKLIKSFIQKNILRLIPFFFSLETNFDNVKIIKEALNESLKRVNINSVEYMNIHLLSSFINWISSFIRGNLKLEFDSKNIDTQIIGEKYENLILSIFKLIMIIPAFL